MTEERKKEIRQFVEDDCKNWCELKLESIESKGKKTYLTVIDSEDYKYNIDLCVLRNARRRDLLLHKFFRNNSYTRYNIENYLKINKKSFTLISDNVNTAIEFLSWNCPVHGDFEISWNAVKNGQGCPICGRLNGNIKRRNTIEYVRTEFEKKDLILISTKYINNESNLDYICKHHKDKGIQKISYGSLISAKGCYYCAKEIQILSQTKTQEQFLSEIKHVFGDRYTVIGQYQNSRIHIEMFCNKCNESFFMTPNHLLEGHGCANCRISRGEERIKLILLNYGVVFIQQYKFSDCKNKRCLPFDFAIFKDEQLYCLIEYQGIQHYKPVETFGGYEQFVSQKLVDNIKKQYCLNNNIKLIEIPYTQYNDIEKILNKHNIKMMEVK